MRLFTEEEKALLKKIADKKASNLFSLIGPYLMDAYVIIDPEKSSVILYLKQTDSLPQRQREIQSIIIQSVNLIKLFEDKGYIFTFRNLFSQIEELQYGLVNIEDPSGPHQFSDTRVAKLVIDYLMREIFVTPELQKFIEDGFITREEVRAKKQRRITWIAISISFIAMVANLIFNLINHVGKSRENPNKPVFVQPECSICNLNVVNSGLASDSCRTYSGMDSLNESPSKVKKDEQQHKYHDSRH